MHPILGCIKISDELRYYLALDLSRDLIHPGEEVGYYNFYVSFPCKLCLSFFEGTTQLDLRK